MPALPIYSAYQFGRDRNLGAQIYQIQHLAVPAHLIGRRLRIQKGYIVDLFQRHNIFGDFVATYWNQGPPEDRERRCDIYFQCKRQFEDALCGGDEESNETEEDLSDATENEITHGFAAEHHLRDFLANNPACIEPGLAIYQEGERNGVEFVIDAGRIDILARDNSDRLVVIELKLRRGRNKTVGQLLYYMGWIDKNLGNGARCRGIIIAKEIPEDLALAVQRVPDVKLFRYNFSFTLEAVAACE